ncbi:MAG: gluconolactonase, partial [Pedobacter sp.]
MKSNAQQLLEVASFEKNQPIGVTVSPVSNRLFVSFPKHEPYLYGLTEIVNGKRKAFPDQEWNKVDSLDTKNHFVNVQDLYADQNNFLWVLDSKPAGASSVFGDSGASKTGQFKLLKIDLKTDQVVRIYEFDD